MAALSVSSVYVWFIPNMVSILVVRIVTLKFEGTHITTGNDTSLVVSQIPCVSLLERGIVIIVQSLRGP